ncbi:hypothetical protein HJC99_00020 [Candidatus Saccharibacteria bacterium]|nr:hypothetical protein [Candidatus Saccharibacteria bacterium]
MKTLMDTAKLTIVIVVFLIIAIPALSMATGIWHTIAVIVFGLVCLGIIITLSRIGRNAQKGPHER